MCRCVRRLMKAVINSTELVAVLAGNTRGVGTSNMVVAFKRNE